MKKGRGRLKGFLKKIVIFFKNPKPFISVGYEELLGPFPDSLNPF